MEHTPTRPWDRQAGAVRDPGPIVEGLLRCFDEQIGGMQPEPSFEAEHRAKLVEACDRFRAFLG